MFYKHYFEHNYKNFGLEFEIIFAGFGELLL